MCYLQFLIYCSSSPEVSVITLSLVYVLGGGGGNAVLHMLPNMLIFWFWKVNLQISKGGISRKENERFFLNYFCCASCRKLLFSYGTLQERTSKNSKLLSVLQTYQFSSVLCWDMNILLNYPTRLIRMQNTWEHLTTCALSIHVITTITKISMFIPL